MSQPVPLNLPAGEARHRDLVDPTALHTALAQGDLKTVCVLLNQLLHDHPQPDAVSYSAFLSQELRALDYEVRLFPEHCAFELAVAPHSYVFEVRLIPSAASVRERYHLMAEPPYRAHDSDLDMGVVLVLSPQRQGIVAWRKFDASGATCGRV